MALLVLLSWHLLRQPRAAWSAAMEAYAAEDYELAYSSFEEVSKTIDMSRLRRNLALSALAAGDLERATLAAEEIARSGAADDLAWRDFLLGNVAWWRSRAAEFEAHGPVPPAGALERAIAFAEQAQSGWQAALERQEEWPQAERNLQRVAARLQALREELAASDGNGETDREQLAPPDPALPTLDPAQQELLMDQLERLDLQELERRAERRAEPEGGWKW
ncbi:MAG: hypothetical protein ACYTEP_02330 [Planctomycetota bacterium]